MAYLNRKKLDKLERVVKEAEILYNRRAVWKTSKKVIVVYIL